MDDKRAWVFLICIVLSLQIGLAIYFLPRKWQACQQLYADRPAQIICLGSK